MDSLYFPELYHQRHIISKRFGNEEDVEVLSKVTPSKISSSSATETKNVSPVTSPYPEQSNNMG